MPVGEREDALTALDEGGGTTVLPRALAERQKPRRREHLLDHARRAAASLDLRVAGIAERTLPGRAGEAALVGWSDATRRSASPARTSSRSATTPVGRPIRARVLEQTARSLALEPNPLDRVAGAVDAALGRVFGLFDALAIVAVIVAALGIVNTLTMNVLERVREIGVLRAAGMTTRQVRRTVVVEAGHPRRRRIDPRHPDGHRRRRRDGRARRRRCRPRLRSAVGLDRPRGRPRDRPVDARGLVSGSPREPARRSCGPSSTSKGGW